MKDAKGHGSDGKGSGPLEGGAAHQGLVQKILATGDVHGAMAHAVTRYDREQADRSAKKGSYYNPNAIGLYLGGVEHVAAAIKGGVSAGTAINSHFNGSLANRLHKALKTGGKDVDSMRRESFK